MKEYPNTPRGNAEAVQQTLFRLQALFRLLILVDDENGLARVKEGDFFESLQYVGELGEDTCGRALHFISLVELHTNDDIDGLEERFTLPVLLSAVLRHRDAPEWLAKGIGELLGENNAIEPDSSEYIAVALGLHE